MGLANAERTLYYLRVLTEFFSQPEYRNLIPIFGILNEPLVNNIGMDQTTSFYLKAYDIIRNITGLGEGNGPVSTFTLEVWHFKIKIAWFSILPSTTVS